LLIGAFFFSDLGPVPILERDSKLSQSGTPRDRIEGGTVENREAKSWHGPCSVLRESRAFLFGRLPVPSGSRPISAL